MNKLNIHIYANQLKIDIRLVIKQELHPISLKLSKLHGTLNKQICGKVQYDKKVLEGCLDMHIHNLFYRSKIYFERLESFLYVNRFF